MSLWLLLSWGLHYSYFTCIFSWIGLQIVTISHIYCHKYSRDFTCSCRKKFTPQVRFQERKKCFPPLVRTHENIIWFIYYSFNHYCETMSVYRVNTLCKLILCAKFWIWFFKGAQNVSYISFKKNNQALKKLTCFYRVELRLTLSG